jgi:hypothetical protein
VVVALGERREGSARSAFRVYAPMRPTASVRRIRIVVGVVDKFGAVMEWPLGFCVGNLRLWLGNIRIRGWRSWCTFGIVLVYRGYVCVCFGNMSLFKNFLTRWFVGYTWVICKEVLITVRKAELGSRKAN